VSPNPRVQRTRPYASLRGSPLTRHPLGGPWILFVVVTVASVGCASRSSAVACPEPSAVTVPYCELVRNADNYHGRRVATEATWWHGFHSDSLFDPSCEYIRDRPASTVVRGESEGDPKYPALEKAVQGGHPLVGLVGVFYVGLRDGDAGPDAQPYGLVVERILSVKQEAAQP